MKKEASEKEKRTLRKVFYTIIVATAIVLFWRGVWQLADLYLFPNNYELSNWISLIAGIIILFMTRNIIDKLK